MLYNRPSSVLGLFRARTVEPRPDTQLRPSLSAALEFGLPRETGRGSPPTVRDETQGNTPEVSTTRT